MVLDVFLYLGFSEVAYNVTKADAVNYIHSTCAEISIVGKSKSHSTPIIIDLPKLLQTTAAECPYCGSLNELIEIYMQKIFEILKTQTIEYATRMMEAARIGNEGMRVCTLIENCIQRGKSIYEGGEKYTFIQPIFVGFATVVDSLTALEELVFTKQKLSLSVFNDIVSKNFEGNEALRQYIINKIPHYGNDNALADKMAVEFAEKIIKLFQTNTLPLQSYMMPGTFTYINHANMGSAMGATFDGRKSGYSYSDGCSAVQGRDINGPTAMILSLTSWEQSKLLGGMVVNMKFNKAQLKGEKKMNFIRLLRTFIQRGGIEIQVTAVSKDELKDARINPDEHADLLVRIGGYSDYFIRLTPTLQQEIIDRMEY